MCSDQFLDEIFNQLHSQSLQPYAGKVLFVILLEAVRPEDAANGLVGLDVHFIVRLELLLLAGCAGLYFRFLLRTGGLGAQIDHKLALYAQIGNQMHFGYFLRFEVYLQAYIFDEIGGLDGKGAFLPLDCEAGRLKWQLTHSPLLVVFYRIVAEYEVPCGVEQHFEYPGLLSHDAGVREPQGLEFANPISSTLPGAFDNLAAYVLLLYVFILEWFGNDLRLGSLDLLLDPLDLFLDVLDFLRSVADLFLHHAVDSFEVSQLLLQFAVGLIPARFQPLGVDLLLGLQLGEGALGAVCVSAVDFGEAGFLRLELGKQMFTFCSRVLTVSMLLLSQPSRFSCICSKSSSLFFKFLFWLISSLSCSACWSKLLARLRLPYSSNLYSKALFLCASSLTSLRSCCSSACLELRSCSEVLMLSIWSCFLRPARELSSRW